MNCYICIARENACLPKETCAEMDVGKEMRSFRPLDNVFALSKVQSPPSRDMGQCVLTSIAPTVEQSVCWEEV